MKLFIFKVRLLILLAIFLVQLGLGSLWQLRGTLVVFLLALIVLSSSFLQLQAIQTQAVAEQVTPIDIPLSETIPVPLTRTQVQQLLVKYEDLLKEQPQHRDLLLNMALLYSAIDEKEHAQTKWDQARKLDPNHSAFTQ